MSKLFKHAALSCLAPALVLGATPALADRGGHRGADHGWHHANTSVTGGSAVRTPATARLSAAITAMTIASLIRAITATLPMLSRSMPIPAPGAAMMVAITAAAAMAPLG